MSEAWLYRQLGHVLAAGNDAVIYSPSKLESCLNGLPLAVANRVSWTRDLAAAGAFAVTVKDGHRDHIPIASKVIAASPSLLVSVEEARTAQIECDAEAHCNNWQLEYGLTPLDVTASGGNASLMILELSS